MRKLIMALSAILLLFACTSEKKMEGNGVIHIDYERAELTSYSDLFTPAEVLPLEYNEGSIISNPHNIAVSNDKLFVFEIGYSKRRKLFAFNLKDGSSAFVKDGSQDKGPGSFYDGSKMLLMQNKDGLSSLGIVGRLQNRMVEFSASDGSLNGITMTPSVNYYCEQFPNQQLFLGFSDNNPIEKYNIHLFSKGQKNNAFEFNATESHLSEFHHSFFIPLHKLEDKIALKELYNDSIYFYYPSGVEQSVYLNFSKGKTERNLVIEKGQISFIAVNEYLKRPTRNAVLMMTQIGDDIILIVDNYEEPTQCMIRFSLSNMAKECDIFRLNLPIPGNKIPTLFLRLRGLYAEGRNIYGVISALEAQNLAKECENYQVEDPFFRNLIAYGNEVNDDANFALVTFELK